MAKQVSGFVKLQVKGGQANPAPPIGPALGSKGVNIMEFCKAFNAATQNRDIGTPVPVVITVYVDKSFTFELKEAPVSYYLLKAAKLDKGSPTTGKTPTIGQVTKAQISEVAKKKMTDLNAFTIEAACRMIEGTAKSMGIQVVEG